jgi:hypothetical protein
MPLRCRCRRRCCRLLLLCVCVDGVAHVGEQEVGVLLTALHQEDQLLYQHLHVPAKGRQDTGGAMVQDKRRMVKTKLKVSNG